MKCKVRQLRLRHIKYTQEVVKTVTFGNNITVCCHLSVTRPRVNRLWKGERSGLGSDLIATHEHPLRVRVGGAHEAAVRLSLSQHVEQWYFSSQAPAHPVSKERQRAHFLSHMLWPTFNGNNSVLCSRVLETFSVAEVCDNQQ